MSRINALRTTVAALLVSVAPGCGPEHVVVSSTGAASLQAAPTVTTHSFSRGDSGAGSRSRVRVLRYPDGSETLVGDTVLHDAGGRGWRLQEEASIGQSGRLVRARLRLGAEGGAGEAIREVRLDAERGAWSISDASGVLAGRLPGQYPWVYGPMFGDIAPELGSATPMAAWIALRAAQGDAAVLMIDPQAGVDAVLSDQVLVSDGPRRWVVMGEEAIEADAEFVKDAPWRRSVDAAVARTGLKAGGCDEAAGTSASL